MNEKSPEIKSQEQLNSEFEEIESRVHRLSDFLEGKVNQTELDFLDDTWGEVANSIGLNRVKISDAHITAMKDIFDSLLDLAKNSKISMQDINQII